MSTTINVSNVSEENAQWDRSPKTYWKVSRAQGAGCISRTPTGIEWYAEAAGRSGDHKAVLAQDFSVPQSANYKPTSAYPVDSTSYNCW